MEDLAIECIWISTHEAVLWMIHSTPGVERHFRTICSPQDTFAQNLTFGPTEDDFDEFDVFSLRQTFSEFGPGQ